MTREEAIRIIETVFQDEYVYKYYDSITHQALNMAIEALHREEAEANGYCHRIRPSNVEVVVRCKDCKHIGVIDEDEGTLYYHCCFWARETDGWGFCHRAERREP